ncbi:MAG: FUSC family protein, partial [Methanomassiliicoccales archaeon]|nr:FUSC family protein [Methanomassiliicoccales archaeon]
GFVAVAGFYFAWVFNVDYGTYAPFFFAIIAAALSNLLFWSVIMPPRPIVAIRRAILSYYLRSAAILSDLATDLELRKTSKKNKRRSRSQLRRLERSMRMIESILPEALDKSGLSDRSEMIRTTLFSTSRAIRLISDEVENFVALERMTMDDSDARLTILLREISSWLRKSAPLDVQERLSSSLKDEVTLINSSVPDGEAKPQASLLRITAELSILLEDARTIKTLSNEIRTAPSHQVVERKDAKAKERKHPLTQTTRIGGWTVSLPTLMAVQALAAGFIALGIGYALDISPSYQTFWFALVTVSGSLGETRLKSFSRIIGTASGVILGLVLAFLVDESSILIIMAILVAFFLLEFSRTISLNWFICFLVTMLVLAMAGAGANPVSFSKSLIISSIIGVGAALLTTNVLFPIKIRARYFSALTEYLVSIRACIMAYTASPKDGHVGVPKRLLMSQAEKYKALEQVSQANLIESNPFSSLDRDRSYETTTIFESLNNAVMKLDADTGMDRETSSPPPTIINSIVEVIGRNISSIETYLKDTRSAPIVDEGGEILKDWMEKEVGKGRPMLSQPYRRDIFPLMDIHDILQVLINSLTKRY